MDIVYINLKESGKFFGSGPHDQRTGHHADTKAAIFPYTNTYSTVLNSVLFGNKKVAVRAPKA